MRIKKDKIKIKVNCLKCSHSEFEYMKEHSVEWDYNNMIKKRFSCPKCHSLIDVNIILK